MYALSRRSCLPVDTLKIDRSLVMKLPESAQGIALAEACSTNTVAERVETREQFEMLTKFGCARSQG